jgi:hypothetical protein
MNKWRGYYRTPQSAWIGYFAYQQSVWIGFISRIVKPEPPTRIIIKVEKKDD